VGAGCPARAPAPAPLPAHRGGTRAGGPGRGGQERARPRGPGTGGAAVGVSVAVPALRALARYGAPAQQEGVAAMLAEHDALDDPAARRRFARGCLRAAVVGPGGGDGATTLVLAGVGGAIALAAGLAAFGLVHYPGLRDGWSWLVYLGLFVA